MKRGKLIAIEGTDASGKNTQTTLLYNKLIEMNIPVVRDTFPRYNTPTGRIIGGPLLGKPEIGESYFENPADVDPITFSLFYAADRRFSLHFINETLDSGKNLILDRYVASNMGHQGGKIRNPVEREEFYKLLEQLEFGMCKLPRPDLTAFLLMPFEKGIELKSKMNVQKDEVEKDFNYLKNSEESYLQLAQLYNWKTINCVKGDKIKTPQEIHEELFSTVQKIL